MARLVLSRRAPLAQDRGHAEVGLAGVAAEQEVLGVLAAGGPAHRGPLLVGDDLAGSAAPAGGLDELQRGPLRAAEKPVAITVTLILSFIDSTIEVPAMIRASSSAFAVMIFSTSSYSERQKS